MRLHFEEFQALMDCFSVGGKKVRSYDMLCWYRQCLPNDSTRAQIYDTYMRRQRKLHRLPKDAAAVLEEIKDKLRGWIKETKYNRDERLENEFDVLNQGKMRHHTFRAK